MITFDPHTYFRLQWPKGECIFNARALYETYISIYIRDRYHYSKRVACRWLGRSTPVTISPEERGTPMSQRIHAFSFVELLVVMVVFTGIVALILPNSAQTTIWTVMGNSKHLKHFQSNSWWASSRGIPLLQPDNSFFQIDDHFLTRGFVNPDNFQRVIYSNAVCPNIMIIITIKNE